MLRELATSEVPVGLGWPRSGDPGQVVDVIRVHPDQSPGAVRGELPAGDPATQRSDAHARCGRRRQTTIRRIDGWVDSCLTSWLPMPSGAAFQAVRRQLLLREVRSEAFHCRGGAKKTGGLRSSRAKGMARIWHACHFEPNATRCNRRSERNIGAHLHGTAAPDLRFRRSGADRGGGCEGTRTHGLSRVKRTL